MTDWPEVVRQHGPLVWRTAYRLLAHDADAADCFQRTFLAAVELARAEPVRNWPAALRRLATARALEQLRQRLRHRGRFEPLPDGGGEPGRSPDPVEAAAGGELAESLRRAPPRPRGASPERGKGRKAKGRCHEGVRNERRKPPARAGLAGPSRRGLAGRPGPGRAAVRTAGRDGRGRRVPPVHRSAVRRQEE